MYLPLKKLELSGNASITGNVHYNLLEMASGADVNGNMVHDLEEKKRLEHQSDADASEKNLHNIDPAASVHS